MKQSFSMSRMTILSLTKFVIQYIYLVFLQNYDRFKLCVFVLWGKLSLPPPSIVERRDDSTTELAHFSRKFSGAQEKLLAPARRERERARERERFIWGNICATSFVLVPPPKKVALLDSSFAAIRVWGWLCFIFVPRETLEGEQEDIVVTNSYKS